MVGQSWANTQYFNPRHIGGLVLWLDGADPSANGVPPSNGSSVSSWVDKSTRGNNYSQGTGANQPVFNTNQMNGKGVLTFSASRYMTGGTTGFPTGSAARTIFAVSKSTSIATQQYHLAYGTANPSQYFGSAFVGSNLIADTFSSWASGNTTLSSNTNYLTEINYPGTGLISTVSLIVNGTSQTVTGHSDAVPNTVLGSGYVSTYPFSPGTLGLIGQIAELIIYNSSLSATAQGNVRRYLANKWGITA